MSEFVVVRLDPLLLVALVFAFENSALVLRFDLYLISVQ